MIFKFIVNWRFCLLTVLVLGLTGCGEDLTPDYMAESPKILCIQIDPPEIDWGERVALRLLVGGKGVKQDMTNPIAWSLTLDGTGPQLGEGPYNRSLWLDTTDWEMAAVSAPLMEAYETAGWVDIPLYATIVVDGKRLFGQKNLRMASKTKPLPVQENPVILGINFTIEVENGVKTTAIESPGQRLDVDTAFTKAFAVTAEVDEALMTSGHHYIYRWHTSFATRRFAETSSPPGKLYISEGEAIITRLLGEGAKASETKKSAVFSLFGEDGDDDTPQFGLYDVYLVVRDKADQAQSRAEDRLGAAFFYFTICVQCDGDS